MRVEFLDTTLRDGAQADGVSFSLNEKLAAFRLLCSLGFDLIECGNPASNPKDALVFRELASVGAMGPQVCAFGMCRRAGVPAVEDQGLAVLLESAAPVISIVGKTSARQVLSVLRVTREENLAMIADSVGFLVSKGRRVLFDAEHFFLGFTEDPGYALACVDAALGAGAERAVLCDTTGTATPDDVERTVRVLGDRTARTGVHFHNDRGLAVANTLCAVNNGITHVQGTLNGFGERCGNTPLCVVAPLLALSPQGYSSGVDIGRLTAACAQMAELSGCELDPGTPFVGKNAFAHKGGIHIDAMLKDPLSYEHVEAEFTGNERRFVISEVAGRSAILRKASKYADITGKDDRNAVRLIDALKAKESNGYAYESADASFELFVMQTFGLLNPPYAVELYRVFEGRGHASAHEPSSAIVKVSVDGTSEMSAAEGNGPVNALDSALRKALEIFFPRITGLTLTDYKVRVVGSGMASASRVRVLITSVNAQETFTTVGVSTDVVDASFKALLDSFTYHLIKTAPDGAGKP